MESSQLKGSGGVLNVDWSWKHSRRSISDHSSQSYRKSPNAYAGSGNVQQKPVRWMGMVCG